MAWITSASASARRPAPRARATAEATPPPIPPADIVCISMTSGNTIQTPASADRLEEVDLELEGGERLALVEARRVGHAHGRVRDVAEHAAVQRAHRVQMPGPRVERDDRAPGVHEGEGEADQGRDGGWGR